MSGTVLDHPLVRDYLRELEAALRGLPAAQAHELKEQITGHLEDALRPDADDYEVAATLSWLGSPVELAAEAGASGPLGSAGAAGSRAALGSWRVRWRLAAVVAIPTVIAAVFGAVQISGEVSHVVTSGRYQRLAQLNAAVVKLTQNLEDERDLSGAYVAGGGPGAAGSVPAALAKARQATDAAARTVRADAGGVGAGYQPATVQDLKTLLASLSDLGPVRKVTSSGTQGATAVIRLYTADIIGSANTFSAAVGGGINDAFWQGHVTTLSALLEAENEESVQRAILFAALSAQPPVFPLAGLGDLTQAFQQEQADLADFSAATDPAEQERWSNTVYGPAVNSARAQEDLAEQAATAHPSAPLTTRTGLDAATWYSDMSTTIGDMRQVTNQLAGQLTVRANTLKSNAAKSLLIVGIVTLGVLFLVLLLATALARALVRPLRRPRSGSLDARAADRDGPRLPAARSPTRPRLLTRPVY